MITELGEIVSLVESGWRTAPVLVVGDAMLDKYVWGEVERISPEAPVPVVRATLQDEKPGGAANVAMNLAGLGPASRCAASPAAIPSRSDWSRCWPKLELSRP